MAADSTSLLSEDDSVRVIACWDNYIINRIAVWNIDPSTFTAEQQNLFNQIAEALLVANKNYTLASIGMGRSSGSSPVVGLVCTFYTNAGKTKSNTIGMAVNTSKLAYGQMRIAAPATEVTDRNMESVASKAENIKDLVRAFIATISGDFNMTPNNYFLPTSCQFTAVSGGKSFTLSKE